MYVNDKKIIMSLKLCVYVCMKSVSLISVPFLCNVKHIMGKIFLASGQISK